MSELDDWGRPHFEPGGGEAFLIYLAFGTFPTPPPPFSRSRYHSAGPGAGFDVRAFDRQQHGDWIAGWTEGSFGRRLAQEDPELYARVRQAPGCIAIEVRAHDPETLNYLRDAVGFASYLLDHGGVALLDPQTLRWYAPERWQEEVFEPRAPQPRQHVVTLVSEEGGQRAWVHTRGLRKFGRPDLSVRGVPVDLMDAVFDLCSRFIELQAFGGRIAEGQEVRMRSLPPGLTCHLRGDLDDPDFNNVHLEIRGAPLGA